MCWSMCFVFFIGWCFGGTGQIEPPTDFDAVKSVLESQEAAWNRGDPEGFMEGYLPSERLIFIGQRGLTHGWRQTLANYKKSYPDRAAMGRLTFEILHMEKLGTEHMLVIGKWRLDREEKSDAQGHFSLIWKKIEGRWLIIADHSS